MGAWRNLQARKLTKSKSSCPRRDHTDFFKTQIFDISAYPEHAKNYVWYNFECDQIFADPAGQYLKKISIFRPPKKNSKKAKIKKFSYILVGPLLLQNIKNKLGV